MGEKEVPLFKYTFHVGGNFTSMPFKYVGGKVKVYESLEYFTTWLQFVEFIKSFSFENVKNVYQQVSLESIDNHEALRHIYDEDTVAAALKLVCERSGCVFFLEHRNEHCIFNPQSGDTGLNLLGTRLIHNDGEREDGGVEELQTCFKMGQLNMESAKLQGHKRRGLRRVDAPYYF
ncbi:hypothetical protein Tco_1519109 [Tanacetum coccineum]